MTPPVTRRRRLDRPNIRQLPLIALALGAALLALPVAAQAATAVFTSNSADTPALTATNSSPGRGAKAVYGNAYATTGKVYGVYGRSDSNRGYGVYSAGRLGSSGPLVCAQCVDGGDLDIASVPTVPDADKLAGHPAAYYARVVPLSTVLALDDQNHVVADVGGLQVIGDCTHYGKEFLLVQPDDGAGPGTVNYFYVSGPNAQSGGAGTTAGAQVQIAMSAGGGQTEGTVIYRSSAGRIVTVNFHLYDAGCELFGDVLTSA